MLTAMYDASLDQFKKQAWEKPSLWDHLFTRPKMESDLCFGNGTIVGEI